MLALVAHTFVDVHVAPGVQAMHTPAGLQTPVTAPCVHAVPAARNV
jgi:hypothetical protein